jgi:hypothetical protein
MVAAAVPTLVFAAADGVGGLGPAVIAAMVSGVLVLGWRLRARRQTRHAILGTLLALICAPWRQGPARSFTGVCAAPGRHRRVAHDDGIFATGIPYRARVRSDSRS